MLIGLYLGFTRENDNVLIDDRGTSPKVDHSLKTPADNGGNFLELERPDKGLSTLIGKDVKTLKNSLGEPDRVDPSAYGYSWWIYNQDYNKYIQVGVTQGKVVTAYAIGAEADITPFKIGQSVEEIFSLAIIETNVDLEYEESSYRFELSEEDMNIRPLIKMGDVFVQLYLDKFTGTLSSVRFMDGSTLVKQRPYEMVYRGELLEKPPISEELWQQIEEGTKQQIFDITNVIRIRYELNELEWDEETAAVAYSHSKDMFESNYFSHESNENGSLSDRLEAANVFYELAGENIAANYTDGPSVVEGWINSKGHRETLLNDEFTHLGVGVFQKHYTQNFIKRWEE